MPQPRVSSPNWAVWFNLRTSFCEPPASRKAFIALMTTRPVLRFRPFSASHEPAQTKHRNGPPLWGPCKGVRRACRPQWTIEIERCRRWEAPLINPSVASHGEMWTMLMQMIPSAEAIGQGNREASKTIGARTFVTRVAFTHAATLCSASGSRSEGWKTRRGKLLAK
jgi:hypothetical protein